MADAIKKARERLDEVIAKGEAVLRTKQQGSMGHHYLEDSDGYMQWRLSARTVLDSLNQNGKFEAEFEKIDANKSSWAGPPERLADQLAILKSLAENHDGGHLVNIRGAVRAEVFGDFLEQAKHLLDEGYWEGAALVVSAVLEDHLRKLCAKHPTITLPAKPTINGMNDALAKVGQYDGTRQKQVLFWAGIRNDAAHGDWKKLKKADVEGLLRDVPGFLTDNPL
jgi:hypothetical protein